MTLVMIFFFHDAFMIDFVAYNVLFPKFISSIPPLTSATIVLNSNGVAPTLTARVEWSNCF